MYNIKPEIYYDYQNLTIEEVKNAHKSRQTITGFVESVSESGDELIVRLGNDLQARLPFSEVSIYPLRYSKKFESAIPTNVHCLLNRKIRAKVLKITKDGIFLSRKKNMEQALKKIQMQSRIQMYITEVITKTAFGDVGEGIVGKLYINDVCRSHIHSVRECIKRGQTIEVIALGFDNENRLGVSYRQAHAPYKLEDYPVGTHLIAKVGDYLQVAKISKYYVSVTPQVSGLLIIRDRKHLEYGSEINCVVTDATERGLYLELA